MRRLLALLLFAAGPPSFADPPLTVPAGFTITKVAGPPLVTFPVVGDFDDKGRLYVVDVAGPVTREDVAAKKPLHRIVRLEDANGDGVFDKAVTFADKLPFPEGCLWHAGSVYTACPPHILKLTDTDGDGVADKRGVWFDGGTLTGCANDLHGPYRGPDGYFYWTKGAFAKQTHTLGDGTQFTTRAAHVFRAKPDGSGLEVVMTGGMDNPVGVAFTASGDVIVSNTFLQHPAGGRRDGLIHAVPGGVWGKDHDPVYDHPWTAPQLMPVMTHLGPAAPAGLRRYESGHFGDDFRDNLFCAQFNLRKVSRHVLLPHGSTYRTQDTDFVTSGDPDFHPTDVIEAADGSLLVIDTGGWYKLCCPSSQLVKADARGGIYRVKKVGGPVARRDVQGDDFTIRYRTVAVSFEAAQERQRVAYAIGLHRDKHRVRDLVGLLKDPSMPVRRTAATALGRLGDATSIPAIFAALADDKIDQPLRHALTFALIEIGDRVETGFGLTHKSARVRGAALMALDGMGGGKVALADIEAAFADNPAVAIWIAGRHPEWAADLAGVFDRWIDSRPDPDDMAALVLTIAKFAADKSVQTVVATNARANLHVLAHRRAVAFLVMKAAKLKTPPPSWYEAVAENLSDDTPEEHVRRALATLRSLPAPRQPVPKLALPLKALARGSRHPTDVRLAAIVALRGDAPTDEASLAFVFANLGRDTAAALRADAAEVLTQTPLSADQLIRLATALKTASPLDIGKLLLIFAKSTDEAAGLALVAALNEPKARAAIRSEQVRPVLARYPAAVQAEAAKLYAVLDADLLRQREKLEALLKELPAGDAARGHKVFNSPKAACAACHTIGYVGGTTGPDLTRVGSVRTAADLLESIVFPSASFVRSYEPVSVVTTDGRQFNGILKADAANHVVLTTAADKEERIARADIETLKPGTVSVMPAGLDQQLSKQDLADLVAFLRASK